MHIDLTCHSLSNFERGLSCLIVTTWLVQSKCWTKYLQHKTKTFKKAKHGSTVKMYVCMYCILYQRNSSHRNPGGRRLISFGFQTFICTFTNKVKHTRRKRERERSLPAHFDSLVESSSNSTGQQAQLGHFVIHRAAKDIQASVQA